MAFLSCCKTFIFLNIPQEISKEEQFTLEQLGWPKMLKLVVQLALSIDRLTTTISRLVLMWF